MRQLDPQRRGGVDTRDGEPAAPVLIRVPDLNAPRRTLEVAPRPEAPSREDRVSETVVPPRLDASSKTTAFGGTGGLPASIPQTRADEPLAPLDEPAREEKIESTTTPAPSPEGLRPPLAAGEEKAASTTTYVPPAAPAHAYNRPALREKLSGSSSGRVPPLAVLAGVLVAGVFLGMTMLRGGSDSDADAGPALPPSLVEDGAAAAGGLAPPYAPPRIELDPSL
jgi:hypothetical protein